MTVDFLRSCYKSKFLVNAVTGEFVIGRFYRPPPKTPVYTQETIIRSSIWIGKEYLDNDAGDTLEDFTYDKGEADFLVTSDAKRTRLAQVGCDKGLYLVPGSSGFPFQCGPVPMEFVLVSWTIGWWFEDPDGNFNIQAFLPVPVVVPRTGNYLWEISQTAPFLNVRIKIFLEGEFLVLQVTGISGIGLEAVRTTKLALRTVGEINYLPAGVISAPWVDLFPVPPWDPVIQLF